MACGRFLGYKQPYYDAIYCHLNNDMHCLDCIGNGMIGKTIIEVLQNETKR